MDKRGFKPRIIEGGKLEKQREVLDKISPFLPEGILNLEEDVELRDSIDDFSAAALVPFLEKDNLFQGEEMRQYPLHFFEIRGNIIIEIYCETMMYENFDGELKPRAFVKTKIYLPKIPHTFEPIKLKEIGFVEQYKAGKAAAMVGLERPVSALIDIDKTEIERHLHNIKEKIAIPATNRPKAADVVEKDLGALGAGGVVGFLTEKSIGAAKVRDMDKEVKRQQEELDSPESYSCDFNLGFKLDPIPEDFSLERFAEIIIALIRLGQKTADVYIQDVRTNIASKESNKELRPYFHPEDPLDTIKAGIQHTGKPKGTKWSKIFDDEKKILKLMKEKNKKVAESLQT